MKLSGYILIILMIGLCFAIVGSIVSDFETQYPEVDVNSSWQDEYNYQETIGQNNTLLQRAVTKMSDEDTGWILKALIGVAAIPIAMITAIGILFSSMGRGINLLTDVSNEIGVPSFVIPFAITALTIIIVWGIISWWRSKGKA